MKYVLCNVVLIAALGCVSTDSHAGCGWEEFRAVNRTGWKDALGRCSPAEQVEIYIKSVFSTIPANYDLVDAIAGQGKNVVPALVERIERSDSLEDELNMPELLFVLVRMQSSGSYAVAEDKRVMARLSAAVRAMKEEGLKEATEQSLGRLTSPSGAAKAR